LNNEVNSPAQAGFRAGVLGDVGAVAAASRALAAGAVVGVGFANFYALTARADEGTVRGVNLLKGRPVSQVGSIAVPPAGILDLWDLDRLPTGLNSHSAREIVDAFYNLGPFGFRGPARDGLPSHLTSDDNGTTTTQVIAPGYACPSNAFLQGCLTATGDEFLYITSANRSRHLTGADDSPAHWRAEGLQAEFGDQPGFCLLAHDDEDAARQRYPNHLTMSTTVLALHGTSYIPGDRRPHLSLDRHGSLHVDTVRAVLADLGFGLLLGPRATPRLTLRGYESGLGDPSPTGPT
jgi:tRNA A37 threonylcarbamoyladenosine synthetase subunit TsaC/SUA5/YrdC